MLQRAAGRLQIFEKDAPGDRVHDEMMSHDQKSLTTLRAEIEEREARDRPDREVERGLDPGRGLGEDVRPPLLRKVGEVAADQGG